MNLTVDELIKLYENADIVLSDVHIITVPAGSRAQDTTTSRGSCGFVIPLSGCASYTLEGQRYIMQKGRILHAGDAMPLEKEVLSERCWKYALLHYACKNPDSVLPYTHYCLNVSQEISAELMTILHSLKRDTGGDIRIQTMRRTGLLYEFVSVILRLAEEHQLALDRKTVRPALRMLDENFAESFVVGELADRCCMSEKEFYSVFRRETGETPKHYIIRKRMEEAQRLLDLGVPITTVALQVGYRDPLYFSRIFRKYFQMSPKAYQLSHSEKSM